MPKTAFVFVYAKCQLAAITKYILRTNMHGVALENFKSTYLVGILKFFLHAFTYLPSLDTSPHPHPVVHTVTLPLKSISGSAGKSDHQTQRYLVPKILRWGIYQSFYNRL